MQEMNEIVPRKKKNATRIGPFKQALNVDRGRIPLFASKALSFTDTAVLYTILPQNRKEKKNTS